jgi:hypothetical protein
MCDVVHASKKVSSKATSGSNRYPRIPGSMVLDAIEQAPRILASYIEPRPRNERATRQEREGSPGLLQAG